jgi:hypothetical protein
MSKTILPKSLRKKIRRLKTDWRRQLIREDEIKRRIETIRKHYDGIS